MTKLNFGNHSDVNNAVSVTDPGSVPYMDLRPENFSQIVSSSKQLAESSDWIVQTPAGLFVHGYKQVRSILRDQRWISVLSGISMLDSLESTASDLNILFERARRSITDVEVSSNFNIRPNVLSVEGDDHKRLRKLVNSSFTSKSADRLRPFMREHASELMNSLVRNSTSEIVQEFCRPYPIPIICRLLGSDDKDWELFDYWAEVIFSALDADTDSVIIRLDEIAAAQKELDNYIKNLIYNRSNEPKDDLISELIQSQVDGDALSSDELIAMVEALLLAGTDTTRNQLGATIAVLADHPEQYSILRERRELIPAAIEESLRYIGAVRTTARLAVEDITFEGKFFPAGSTVLLGLHAASLGETEDDDGYIFNILRERECPHMAFGSGAHHCLGAFLARAELQEALSVFVDRVPSIDLVSPVEWKPLSMGIWGPSRLEITFKSSSGKKLYKAGTNRESESVYVTGRVSDKKEDQLIKEASKKRYEIQKSIPHLIQRPKFPPIKRLLTTVLNFGKAIIIWKLIDSRKEEETEKNLLYRRVREAAERLGPTYIKLAQLISAAEGIFPEPLIAECKKCRDEVRAESWVTVRKTIENELGPIDKIFKSINPVPIAAASIAQVHSAKLVDGSSVVIKVQRQKIQDQVKSDLKVMAWLAPKFVGRIPIAALTNPPALVELFAETICEELDFQLEVSNLFEIERALKSNPKNTWELPIPNLDYVTSKIIVMSRVEGFSLGEANEMKMNADRVSAVFRQMVDGLLEGAVIHGIFHGDFHAGNVFLDTDGQIGLVDFGITGRLNGDRRIAFLRYVVGLMTGDVEAQIMGLRDLGAFPLDTDVQTVIKDFQLERDDFDPLEMSEEEFVEEIQVIVRDLLAHGARIPKELMLFVKNFAYLSSVIQNLSPEMDLLAEFEKISSGFFTRNGLRVATEVGFSVTSDDISDQSFRRAAGLRDSEKTLTWDALQKRRNEAIQRIPVKSVVDELQEKI